VSEHDNDFVEMTVPGGPAIEVMNGAGHLPPERAMRLAQRATQHYQSMPHGTVDRPWSTSTYRAQVPYLGEFWAAVGGRHMPGGAVALKVLIFTRSDLPAIKEMDAELYRQVQDDLRTRDAGIGGMPV
jgi:hypothetical protein